MVQIWPLAGQIHPVAGMYEKRGGGEGVGPKSVCTKKWLNKTYPILNFFASRDDHHFGWGGGGLLRLSAVLIHLCPVGSGGGGGCIEAGGVP